MLDEQTIDAMVDAGVAADICNQQGGLPITDRGRAIAALAEHLRAWLWEKHRVWITPNSDTDTGGWFAWKEPGVDLPTDCFPCKVAEGPTYRDCLAAAVMTTKEQDNG